VRGGYTDGAVAEYRAWAEGDVFGWVLTSPNGAKVDSCWGYYGFSRERERTLSEAREAAQAHAREAIEQTNTAGAGFIGNV
jgi:hypothetical protein